MSVKSTREPVTAQVTTYPCLFTYQHDKGAGYEFTVLLSSDSKGVVVHAGERAEYTVGHCGLHWDTGSNAHRWLKTKERIFLENTP